MRIILLLFIVFFCSSIVVDAQVVLKRKVFRSGSKTVTEQIDNESGPLIGKWSEYQRTKGNSQIVFTDTLKLDFLTDSTVFNYLPKAKIEREQYGFQGDSFYYDKSKKMHSFSLENGELRIGTDDFVSHLRKVDNFYFKPIEKIIPAEAIGEIETLNEDFLLGSWKVYKKKDPEFSRKNLYFYKVKITKMINEGTFAIEAYYSNSDKLVNDKGTLLIEENLFIMKIMNQTVTYTITKAAGNEIVLMDKDIIYFMSK